MWIRSTGSGPVEDYNYSSSYACLRLLTEFSYTQLLNFRELSLTNKQDLVCYYCIALWIQNIQALYYNGIDISLHNNPLLSHKEINQHYLSDVLLFRCPHIFVNLIWLFYTNMSHLTFLTPCKIYRPLLYFVAGNIKC